MRGFLLAGVLFPFLSHLAKAGHIESDALAISSIAGRDGGIWISSSIHFGIGSSLTLQGAGGYFAGQSSVNAGAFFGDGGGLSGIAKVGSSQVFAGANVFASSFSVASGGRQIVLATGTLTNNLTITPSGIAIFVPELHNSSHAIIPAAGTSASRLGPCVAGSTLTITTTGGRVEVILAATIANTFGSTGTVSILQDGNFMNGFSPDVGLYGINVGVQGTAFVSPIDYLLEAPSPGAHSYCVTIANPRGVGSVFLINGGVIVSGDGRASNLFYVKEIK